MGLGAFRSSPVLVFCGFMGFVAGYKLTWIFEHRHGQGITEVLGTLAGEFSRRNAALTVAGVAASSYGTATFGALVESFTVQTSLIAGLATFGGYMMAHEGVNDVLV